MKKINFKKSKGITMISLIITIVVLMILAGISVTALTGEKNVIKEAKEATSSAKQQSAKEKVQAAVLGCTKKNGEIDKEKLKEKLDLETDIVSFPATIDIDGVEITIGADGSVELAE